jgi:hypothetical protein
LRAQQSPGNVDLDHLMEMPFVGRLTDNTQIMSILCIATQFVVRRAIINADWMCVAKRTPLPGPSLSGKRRGCFLEIFSGLEPVQAFTIWLQVFGFAASIAARLTIWPISLACSASDRIWACTYSLCSRMISVRSLACSNDWA